VTGSKPEREMTHRYWGAINPFTATEGWRPKWFFLACQCEVRGRPSLKDPHAKTHSDSVISKEGKGRKDEHRLHSASCSI